MKEKIIREKNRTSMKKIVERAAAGWRLGAVESLDSGEWRIWRIVCSFVVECGCWDGEWRIWSSSVRSWWNAAAGSGRR